MVKLSRRLELIHPFKFVFKYKGCSHSLWYVAGHKIRCTKCNTVLEEW